MARILVLYYSRQGRLRQAVEDHLYSFREYSGHECVYVNLGVPWVPRAAKMLRYDLVVFHPILLWERVDPPRFEAALRRAEFVRNIDAPKVMLPQDEHLCSRALVDMIERFDVRHVFSCAGANTWPSLYPDAPQDVVFHTVLTGYLSDSTREKISRLSKGLTQRTIDIGYRAWDPWPSLGKHGRLKVEVGERVGEAARATGMRTDISNRVEDTLLGDDWYRFLLSCKYTVGVEGGASVPDPDGSVMRCTLDYAAANADAVFEDFEEACFPGLDGTLDYFAISPRHLEACATRTCQVLIEGEYSGVLRPGVHYLELKKDFSNVDDVVRAMSEDVLRDELVKNAYSDVIASGRYTYRGFVSGLLAAVWPEGAPARSSSPGDRVAQLLLSIRDRVTWPTLVVAWGARTLLERLVGRQRVSSAVAGARRRLGE